MNDIKKQIVEKLKELADWLDKQKSSEGLLLLYISGFNQELKEWLKLQKSPRGMMIFNTIERLQNE
jgi:hypothetical protein